MENQPQFVIPISPIEINNFVEQLLDAMNAEFEPEIIQVEILPDGKEASCFFNVQEKIKLCGGKIHFGWVIWQHGYLIEAEHHAVWEDDEGNLLDVTPRKEFYKTIMFLPDNSNVFDGRMAQPNFRLNITNNKLIDDFIVYSETIDKLYGMGKRINDQMLSLPEQIVSVINLLDISKHNVLQFYMYNNDEKSNCFCNSSKPYLNCHGVNVRNLSNEILKRAEKLLTH